MAEGIDGWRLDVPWKASPELWPEFFQRVLSHDPDAYVVTETWRGTRDWTTGDRAHGVMNYRLRQNILDYAAFNHQDAEDFDYEVHQLLAEHGATAAHHLTLLGSHDTPRILTLCKGDVGRAIIAIALQMTLPGVPMVYYGDEIGMEGENDPDCRRPMIWDESRWCWPIWDATRALIGLRHQNEAIRHGELRTLRVFNGVYAYARVHADAAPVVVVLNPRDEQPKLSIPLGDLSQHTDWIDVLSETRYTVSGGTLTFEPLAPQSAHVLVPAGGAWQK
jgi:glycosidase